MVLFLVAIWQKIVTTLTCWYNFDGLNEYIDIGNKASLSFERTDSFSISTWILPIATTQEVFLSKRDSTSPFRGFEHQIILGKFRFILANASPSNDILIELDQVLSTVIFNNITITYDGSSTAAGIEIYLDGVKGTYNIIRDNLSSTILNTSPFLIGKRVGVQYEGAIDEVSVFDTVLSQTEVTDIYNLGRTNPDLTTIDAYNTNGISHWRMGENDTFVSPNWTIVDELRREWTEYDGINEYTTMGDVLEFDRTDNFSYSFWLNYDTNNSAVISKLDSSAPNSGYEISLTSSDEILFSLINNGSTNRYRKKTTTMLSNGVWYNIVCVWDGTMKIYIDGISDTLVTIATNLSSSILNNIPLELGARNGTFLLDGNLDDVSVYNVALSQLEVTDIYNRSRNSPDYSNITGIVSHWKLEVLNPTDQIGANDGTSVNQTSSNLLNDINDGTSNNMDVNNKVCE